MARPSTSMAALLALGMVTVQGCAVNSQDEEAPLAADELEGSDDALVAGAPAKYQGVPLVDKGEQIRASYPRDAVDLLPELPTIPFYVQPKTTIQQFSATITNNSNPRGPQPSFNTTCATPRLTAACKYEVTPNVTGPATLRVTLKGKFRGPQGNVRDVMTTFELKVGESLLSVGAAAASAAPPGDRVRFRAPLPGTNCIERGIRQDSTSILSTNRCDRDSDWRRAQEFFFQPETKTLPNGTPITVYRIGNDRDCTNAAFLTHSRDNWTSGQLKYLSWGDYNNGNNDQLWVLVPVNGQYRLRAYGTRQVVTRSANDQLTLTFRNSWDSNQLWLTDRTDMPVPSDAPDLGIDMMATVNRTVRIRGINWDSRCLATGASTESNNTRGTINLIDCPSGWPVTVGEPWDLKRTNEGSLDAQFTLRNPRIDNTVRYLSLEFDNPGWCERKWNKMPTRFLWTDYEGPTQQWRFVRDTGSNYYRIQSVYTGLFLQRQSQSATLMPFAYDEAQLWSVENGDTSAQVLRPQVW